MITADESELPFRLPSSDSNSTSNNNSVVAVLDDAALLDDLKLLQLGESCAFAFMFTDYSNLRSPVLLAITWPT